MVFSAKDAIEQAKQVHGVDSGVFVEKFLKGREFTAFIMGDAQQGLHVYDVVERVFNTKLKTFERILAFDRYWDGYDLNGKISLFHQMHAFSWAMSGNAPQNAEQLYWYEKAPENFQHRLKTIAQNAYVSLGGSGYGRVDMRTDSLDGSDEDAWVLEVNANCGISFNVNEFTSTHGEILRLSNSSILEFTRELLSYARNRQKATSERH